MASLSNPFDVLTGLGAPAAKGGMAFQNPVSTIGPSGVTSGFGHRSSPMGIGSRNHGGIDLAARGAGGGYAAEAAAGGTVTFAGRAGGYGNMVEVTHADGSKTRYGHLQSMNVKVGDQVAAGTPVGKVGSTGKSTGPHLHFEVIDKNGQKVNPKSVTDLANRSLSVTPTPRPSDDIGALMAFEAGPVPPSFTAPDPSRFGPAQISPAASLASISRPSPNIDPARFGPVDISPAASVASFSQPSAERFGYAPEAKSGSLGGLGGMSAKAAIDPDRFGPAQMTSTPTTGRLSSTVNASNSTPMAASLSPVGIGPQSLSSPVQRAAEDAGYLTTHVNTTSVAPTAMGLLPSTAQAPVGSFSTFNPMPTDLNVLDKALNRLPTNPPLSLPNMPVIPSVVPPTVQPMITPTVTKQPVSPQTTASVRPSQPPMATAADVYAGRATTGVASNGATVSRDPVTGNISVTNQFGATTVTDPSGRQMGNLSGVGKAIGDKVTPGMIGAVVGGAVAGLPGAVAGYALGNRASGQTGQKTGGLGGLGGFLSGLFGGGNSSNGGGGSSSGRGGGSSGSRGGPAGADRDHAGNG